MAYYLPDKFFEDDGEPTLPKAGDIISYDKAADRFSLERKERTLACVVRDASEPTQFWTPTVAYTEIYAIVYRVSMLTRPYLNVRLCRDKDIPDTIERWKLIH